MEILQKISLFFERYRKAITIGLVLCCFMQQCTISTLRSEIEFYRDKYGMSVQNNETSERTSDIYDENRAVEQTPISGQTENEYKGGDKSMSMTTMAIIFIGIVAVTAVLVMIFRKKSIYPFSVRVSGKLWQDLNGRVIYTLTISNKSNGSAEVDNATIEFINMKERRKFRMPVADFPLTLTKGTKHSVNISLQRLLEQHQELLEYKLIRVAVESDKKVKKTFPLGIKWKKA